MSPHATIPDNQPNHHKDNLRELKPNVTDEDIHAAAENFENTLYQRSTNKNQYIIAYARKLYQIRYQIQLSKQNDVVPNINSSSEQND
ncbi:unnamed protein product [Cunninghamella echinulata]